VREGIATSRGDLVKRRADKNSGRTTRSVDAALANVASGGRGELMLLAKPGLVVRAHSRRATLPYG